MADLYSLLKHQEIRNRARELGVEIIRAKSGAMPGGGYCFVQVDRGAK